jgi:hypothetical protein
MGFSICEICQKRIYDKDIKKSKFYKGKTYCSNQCKDQVVWKNLKGGI